MACVVVKFGGTSVGSIEKIKAAAGKVLDLKEQGKDVVVVVSAMSGETNRLAGLAGSFSLSDSKSYDTVVSTGEQVTTGLMAMALQDLGAKAQALQGWQLPIVTSSDFSKARIESISDHKLKSLFDQSIIPVLPGFQGVTLSGEITTLGRGGSDVTAVVVAAALKADSCILYKDVPGILSSDPKLVEEPKVLDQLGIEEMFEQSSQGAKVVHPRAIEAALIHDVDLRICPTFDKGEGTYVTKTPLESQTVTGIVCNAGEVRIVLQDIPLGPGATACLFDDFAKAHISIDMILQGSGITDKRQTQNLTFTIAKEDQKEAVDIVEKLKSQIGFSQMEVQPRIAKVSVVGAGLRGHASVASVVQKTLSDLGISLYGMATTELKMSVLVSDEYAPQLVQSLHDNFKLTQTKEEHDDKPATHSA